MDDPSIHENGSIFSLCQQHWIEYAFAFDSQLNNIEEWVVLLLVRGACSYLFLFFFLASYLACRAQDLLKRELIVEVDFTWAISLEGSSLQEGFKTEKVKCIGGVDASFLKRALLQHVLLL